MKEIFGPFTILIESIDTTLAEYNFEIDAGERSQYVLRLSALAQEKIGMELTAHMSPEQVATFNHLLTSDKTSASEWQVFWSTTVPEYEIIIENTLRDFRDRLYEYLDHIT